MQRVDFSFGNYCNADFGRSYFDLARFHDTNLDAANMYWVDLCGANFLRAEIKGAVFEKANLVGTRFYLANNMLTKVSDTNLSTALNLFEEQISSMFGGTDTVLPKGIKSMPTTWPQAELSRAKFHGLWLAAKKEAGLP